MSLDIARNVIVHLLLIPYVTDTTYGLPIAIARGECAPLIGWLLTTVIAGRIALRRERIWCNNTRTIKVVGAKIHKYSCHNLSVILNCLPPSHWTC